MLKKIAVILLLSYAGTSKSMDVEDCCIGIATCTLFWVLLQQPEDAMQFQTYRIVQRVTDLELGRPSGVIQPSIKDQSILLREGQEQERRNRLMRMMR